MEWPVAKPKQATRPKIRKKRPRGKTFFGADVRHVLEGEDAELKDGCFDHFSLEEGVGCHKRLGVGAKYARPWPSLMMVLCRLPLLCRFRLHSSSIRR